MKTAYSASKKTNFGILCTEKNNIAVVEISEICQYGLDSKCQNWKESKSSMILESDLGVAIAVAAPSDGDVLDWVEVAARHWFVVFHDAHQMPKQSFRLFKSQADVRSLDFGSYNAYKYKSESQNFSFWVILGKRPKNTEFEIRNLMEHPILERSLINGMSTYRTKKVRQDWRPGRKKELVNGR